MCDGQDMQVQARLTEQYGEGKASKMSATNLPRANERKAMRLLDYGIQNSLELGKIAGAKAFLAGLVIGDMVKMLDLRRGMKPDAHRSRAWALAETISELVSAAD